MKSETRDSNKDCKIFMDLLTEPNRNANNYVEFDITLPLIYDERSASDVGTLNTCTYTIIYKKAKDDSNWTDAKTVVSTPFTTTIVAGKHDIDSHNNLSLIHI